MMKRIGVVVFVLVCAFFSTMLVSAQDRGSACDAVIQYMKAGREMIRNVAGPERDKRLAELKNQYQEKMQGAPAKAVKLAEAYLDLLRKGWEKADDDTVYQILKARDAALKACGKTAGEARF